MMEQSFSLGYSIVIYYVDVVLETLREQYRTIPELYSAVLNIEVKSLNLVPANTFSV